MNRSSVVVVGGGPAGLFCAAHTAVGGVETILIEKMDRCGRKLLCTGSSRSSLNAGWQYLLNLAGRSSR